MMLPQRRLGHKPTGPGGADEGSLTPTVFIPAPACHRTAPSGRCVFAGRHLVALGVHADMAPVTARLAERPDEPERRTDQLGLDTVRADGRTAGSAIEDVCSGRRKDF